MFWIWIFAALALGTMVGFGLASFVHMARCADCAAERDYAALHLHAAQIKGSSND